ncbi:MAG: sulfatase-like hydrolase/transferase, partial [Chlamydiota bacterium]
KHGVWDEIRRGYLACISFTDDNVGRVMEALENSPYADNTIVVLWSDHGFHLGEKRSHTKFSLWEESTRVPFIVWEFGASVFRVFQGALLEMVTTIPCKTSIRNLEKNLA